MPVRMKRLPRFETLPRLVQDRTAFIINHLYLVIRNRVRRLPELREFHVNLRERLVLEMLYVSGPAGIPQHVLGGYLDIQPTVTTKMLDSLEKRHLVTRTVNPVNRKENLVALTDPYGLYFVKRMLDAVNANTETVSARLTPEYLDDFARMAQRLIAALEENTGEG